MDELFVAKIVGLVVGLAAYLLFVWGFGRMKD